MSLSGGAAVAVSGYNSAPEWCVHPAVSVVSPLTVSFPTFAVVHPVPFALPPAWRKPLALAAGLVVMTVAGVRLTDRADSRRAVRLAMLDGARFGDSLTASAAVAPRAAVSFPSAVALNYLARLELGLGSPFRLVDLARSDPRLPSAWRPRLAHAMLARLSQNFQVMRVTPHALDVAIPDDSGGARALVALVDSVMRADAQPRLSLEALRIAAAQASARGVIRPGAVPLIGAAALLSYDRGRAMRDVEHVITAASRGDGDVLQTVALWRTERRFAVERPLLADAMPAVRRIAARVDPMVAAIERAMATRDTMPVAPAPQVLPASAANALSLLISVRTRPVQPQVRLSVLDARIVTADRHASTSPDLARWLLSVTNEETLPIVMSRAHADPALSRYAATAALLASQGMRTLAQEAAFHPGTLALRPSQVVDRLGLASLTFGADVPAPWQPYYAREFATAVDALRDVFPSASVSGLNVHIGDRVMDGALAVHDPRTRTLSLPLATGFGAIGHEVMHDLDWQSSRDDMRRPGGYATDNAWRGVRTTLLAAPLARLAEFVPLSTPAAVRIEARRPAELLARSADWYLASALARQGRVHGALSAVQDSWIRGYASAVGPDAFGDHAGAVDALFDAMPTLKVRASVVPRGDVEREPDLGAIARAAWFAPLRPPASHHVGESPVLIPDASGAVCSPMARLRLAPTLDPARQIADGFIVPRVERYMRRWARYVRADSVSGDDALLRMAILGAPVRPSVIDSARTEWTRAAWRALPCLAP